MIKDILVNLPVGRLSDSAVNYAVSVAVVFDAHLTGVAFVDEPFVPGTVFNTADFIAAYRAQVEKAAKVAVTKFEDATRRAGVSATSQMLGSTLAGLDDLFTQITRRFDLSVVGQSEFRQGNARSNVPRDRAVRVGTAGTGRALHSERRNETRPNSDLLGRKPGSCTRDRGRHAFFSANQIDRRTVRDEERNGTQRAAGRRYRAPSRTP